MGFQDSMKLETQVDTSTQWHVYTGYILYVYTGHICSSTFRKIKKKADWIMQIWKYSLFKHLQPMPLTVCICRSDFVKTHMYVSTLKHVPLNTLLGIEET